jgi:hypothetical protein
MKRIKEIYYHIDGTPTKEDAKIISDKENYIKATVYYSEGGFSYFTYKQTPRAYFLSAQPVTLAKAGEAGTMESLTMFNNNAFKIMIGEPVNRQSKKKEAEALNYFENNIDRILAENYTALTLEKE